MGKISVNIEKLPELVKSGTISRLEGGKIIWIEVYQFPSRYGINHMNEDERSDFLLWLNEKFQAIFDSYIPEKVSFQSYIRGCIKNYLKTWRRKQSRQDAEEHSFDIFMKDMIEDDNTKFCTENMQEDKIKRRDGTSISKTQQRIAEMSAIILAMKACRDMNDQLLEKLSAFTGIDKEVIQEKTEALKNFMEERSKKRELLIQKRNNAFFFHRKYSIELKKVDENTGYYKLLKTRFNIQTNKWKKQNANLIQFGQAAPPNSEIAKILGIKPRTISFYIKHINEKKNQEIIKELYEIVPDITNKDS